METSHRGDIQLAVIVDGANTTNIPSSGWYNVAVTCDNGATGSWDYDNWTVVIGNLTTSKIKCAINFESMTLTKAVEIGDYIKMTPTSTSYSVPSEANVWGTHTGYSSDQTIKPSELNLWRVIKVNTDGTIEVVSEYISSTKVTYRGGTGYSTLVSSLNNIAAQYVNSNFTSGSRYMGYNGQTKDGSVSFDLSMFCETDDNSSEEEYGCGDVLYEKDTNLVTTAVGTLKANIVNTSTSSAYFLTSRYSYHRENDDMTFTEDYKSARYVSSSGSVLSSPLYYNLYDENDYSTTDNNDVSYYLRPILILKADLYATGSGTSTSPYVLE